MGLTSDTYYGWRPLVILPPDSEAIFALKHDLSFVEGMCALDTGRL